MAQDWRLQARLYPYAIGIPMLILAIVQVILDLKGVKAKESSSATPMDFQFTKDVDPTTAKKRAIIMFAWLIGFLFAYLARRLPHRHSRNDVRLPKVSGAGILEIVDSTDGHRVAMFLGPFRQVAPPAVSRRLGLYLAWDRIVARSALTHHAYSRTARNQHCAALSIGEYVSN